MNTISKERFVATINTLRVQHRHDVYCSGLIAEMFKLEGAGIYGSTYINCILDLLRVFYPKDSDGHCEISHYCFILDFGKIGDEYESPEEFYDRLNVGIV